jgi:electron transport complex protein RnfE
MSQVKTLFKDGMWANNPALVQLLGLCPLLAVTSTVTNALGLGLATLLVLVGSNVTVSIVRNWVPKDIRIPVFVMIIAGFVTIVQLMMNAYTFGLYQSLGIFIPLIVTNCAIIGRAEAFASKNTVPLSAFDGLMMGLGFMLVLVLQAGDTVTLIKDLDVKGSSLVAKRGTAVRNIGLTSNPEHIEGRVDGQRIVILTKYVKK